MPQITINGKTYDFKPGQTILQVALEHDHEIPHYCYHPGLSIPANCRICLAELWAPNPRNNNALEAFPKLMPTCQTAAADGQVVYTDSPKAIANQKAVMEYLLINHPVDCPVCDQAGECYLQDYSYQYGRSASRFQEAKNKQPKKDVGPHVLLYSDRCIMCTRCVRFTREVTGTSELFVEGRGSTAQIDVFPGKPLDNELSGNVVDICPVGALLDKDFLFQQRVWFLKKTPSIDPITASGDNIWIEHAQGRVYRVKPRTNLDVNKWWITDEVRYGWKFIHGDDRITMPRLKGRGEFAPQKAREAWIAAYGAVKARLDGAVSQGGRLAALLSPMIACEDAFLIAEYVRMLDPEAVLGVGPVPFHAEDKSFPGGFTVCAEKAPNARGVRRVLGAMNGGAALECADWIEAVRRQDARAVVLTGNYPSAWATDDLMAALNDRYVVLIDTLESRLCDIASAIIPAATFAEKSGTFENRNGLLQAFERAINPIDFCRSESQIALDLAGLSAGKPAEAYDAASVRARMAGALSLPEFASAVTAPETKVRVESDMVMVDV